ncbi:MAG: hypothetical protein PHH12_02155 [Candidatus Shapirobacteria bacterium]|nr:hypothetical protein [Candidatus Shapirobacteria bacterium]
MKIIKKILKSFLKFVLLTALIHIGVLIFTSIRNGNIKFLNYFQILGLNEFWPEITKGWISDLISGLLMVIIFSIFLIFSLGENRRKMAYFETSHNDKE